MPEKHSTRPAAGQMVIDFGGGDERPGRPRIRKKDQAERDARLCADYAAGARIMELAGRYNIKRCWVHHILKANGVELRSRHVLTEEQAARAAELYRQGRTAQSIAVEFGVGNQTLRKYLESAGVEHIRGRKEANRRKRCRHDAFDDPDESGRYWIGFLMADGCVSGPNANTIKLTASEKDRGHIEKFRAFLGAEHRITYRAGAPATNGMARPQYGVSVSSDRLAAALARYGVVPRKSLTARVVGLERDRDFWRGVIDGDGHISFIRDRYPTIGLTGSWSLVGQFREYVLSIAPDCSAPVVDRGNYCNYQVSGKASRPLIAALYDGCAVALDRKLTLARKAIDWTPQTRRGAEHYAAKLTEADVVRIKQLIGSVTYSEIGRMFGVSHVSIRNITSGKTWSHV